MNTRWLVAGAAILLSVLVAVWFVRASRERAAGDFQREVLAVLRERFPNRRFVADTNPHIIGLEPVGARLGLGNIRAIVESSNASDAERRDLIANFFTQTLVAVDEAVAEAAHSAAATRSAPGSGAAAGSNPGLPTTTSDSPARVTEVPAAWAMARPYIRPQLVPAAFQLDDKLRAIRRHFAADIDLTYVFDLPRRFEYVGEANLAAWKVTTEALHDAAVENLERAIANERIEVTPAKGDNARGGFVTVATEDGYAAAHLVVPSFRRRLQDALGSPYFVATPNRDFLVAWSKDYSHADAFTARASQDARTRPYPISGEVLGVVNGELRPVAAGTPR